MPLWTPLLHETLRSRKTEQQLETLRQKVLARLADSNPALLLAEHVEEEVNSDLVEHHRRSMKERVADCLSAVYLNALRDHLLTDRGVTRVHMARELGVAASQLSRWGKETVPSPSKFFVTVLNWRVDARKILPNWMDPGDVRRQFSLFEPSLQKDIVARGVAMAVEQVLVNDLDEKHQTLRPEELPCVQLVFLDPHCAAFLSPKGRRTVVDAVAERVLAALERAQLATRWTKERVAEVARRWLLAYIVFDAGCPPWEFLHEK